MLRLGTPSIDLTGRVAPRLRGEELRHTYLILTEPGVGYRLALENDEPAGAAAR